MTARLDIPADSAGRIDVLAIDLSPDEIEEFAARNAGTDDPAGAWPLRAALGADFLDPAGVEVIRLRDLEGVGLPGYLTEGLGADEDAVAARRDALDALTGHVAILRGRAYGGIAQTLRPRAPLRHVATLHEAGTPPPGPALRSDGARPGTEAREADDSAPDAVLGTGSPVALIAGALVLAAVLVAALALVLS